MPSNSDRGGDARDRWLAILPRYGGLPCMNEIVLALSSSRATRKLTLGKLDSGLCTCFNEWAVPKTEPIMGGFAIARVPCLRARSLFRPKSSGLSAEIREDTQQPKEAANLTSRPLCRSLMVSFRLCADGAGRSLVASTGDWAHTLVEIPTFRSNEWCVAYWSRDGDPLANRECVY